jgi:hypothetical protein
VLLPSAVVEPFGSKTKLRKGPEAGVIEAMRFELDVGPRRARWNGMRPATLRRYGLGFVTKLNRTLQIDVLPKRTRDARLYSFYFARISLIAH